MCGKVPLRAAAGNATLPGFSNSTLAVTSCYIPSGPGRCAVRRISAREKSLRGVGQRGLNEGVFCGCESRCEIGTADTTQLRALGPAAPPVAWRI
jgi:hypothetical protein